MLKTGKTNSPFGLNQLYGINEYAKNSVFRESIRFAFGLIFYFGDWLAINQLFIFANYVILSYLALSLIVTIYFVNSNFEKETIIVA